MQANTVTARSDVGCIYSLISWVFFHGQQSETGERMDICGRARLRPVRACNIFVHAAGRWGRPDWLAELFLSSADSDEAICIHLCMGPTVESERPRK